MRLALCALLIALIAIKLAASDCNNCGSSCNNNCGSSCNNNNNCGSCCNNNCQNQPCKQSKCASSDCDRPSPPSSASSTRKEESKSDVKTINQRNDKHNITTIINLTNVINNTNKIEVPINVTSTNHNDIAVNQQHDQRLSGHNPAVEWLGGINQRPPPPLPPYIQGFPAFNPCPPPPPFPLPYHPCPYPFNPWFNNATNNGSELIPAPRLINPCPINLFNCTYPRPDPPIDVRGPPDQPARQPRFPPPNFLRPPPANFNVARPPPPPPPPFLPYFVPVRPPPPAISTNFNVARPPPPPPFWPNFVPMPPPPPRVINNTNCRFIHHYPWIRCFRPQPHVERCGTCYSCALRQPLDLCVQHCTTICQNALQNNRMSGIRCTETGGRLRCG